MRSIRVTELKSPAYQRLLSSIVVPRPIAWVGTLAEDGTPNLAPFSFFTIASSDPPTVLVSFSGQRSGRVKDSLLNARETGEFTVSLVHRELAEVMNQSSADYGRGVDEFQATGIDAAAATLVHPPFVAAARVALEAEVTQVVPVADSKSVLLLGRVLMVHADEAVLGPDGLVNAAALQPVARLGRSEYSELGDVFEMLRPTVD